MLKVVGAILIGCVVIVVVPLGIKTWNATCSVKGQDEDSVNENTAVAKENMGKLFSSAQDAFIHRNGTRMASSIDELGFGGRIGNSGALIYDDIWNNRYGAEKTRTSGIYEYAILPVKGLRDEKLDMRTTCVVALPREANYPALLMIAGPVIQDPQDFLRPWEVKEISEEELKRELSTLVRSKSAFGKQEQVKFLTR